MSLTTSAGQQNIGTQHLTLLSTGKKKKRKRDQSGRHKHAGYQLTEVRVNLSQTCSEVEKSSLLFCCLQRAQDAVSFGRERDIWASSAAGPMRATCGCCRTIATANQKPQTHTHTHTHKESDWKVYESPIKLMRSYWTDGITHSLGTGRGVVVGGGRQLEGGWGIRECFIQRVLTSLSVALIYTTPPSTPPLLSSAVCELHSFGISPWPSAVSRLSSTLTCSSRSRPKCALHCVKQWGLQSRSPNELPPRTQNGAQAQ